MELRNKELMLLEQLLENDIAESWEAIQRNVGNTDFTRFWLMSIDEAQGLLFKIRNEMKERNGGE